MDPAVVRVPGVTEVVPPRSMPICVWGEGDIMQIFIVIMCQKVNMPASPVFSIHESDFSRN
jgi:hypothetical protein